MVDRTAAQRKLLRLLFNNKWFLRFLGLVVVVGAWEIYFRFGDVNPVLSAPPSKIALSVRGVLNDKLYLPAVWGTIRLFLIGFAVSVILGVVVGFLIGRSRLLDQLVTPYLNALYSAPLVALIPIMTAVLGYAFRVKLLIVVIVGIFPILINAEQGARGVDPTIVEVARSLRVKRFQMWRDVILPSSLPFLAVGLRLGAARGLIGTAIAELYTSPDGLGYLVRNYSMRYRMGPLFVVVLTYTCIALVFSLSFRRLERRMARWKVPV